MEGREDSAPTDRGRFGMTRGSRFGLVLMLGAVSCFTAMVVCVKLLREGGMSTPEVMFWRMAPGIPWIWLELRHKRAPLGMPLRPVPVALRALFGGLAMGTYFYAVEALSLLQNTVLQLAQPIFVAVLSPFVLSERLRRAALWALVIALLGALIVIVPGEAWTAWQQGMAAESLILAFAAMPLAPGLLRLTSALLSALAHMMIRTATTPGTRDAPPEAPETVVWHFTIAVSVVSAAVTFSRGGFTWPPESSWAATLGLVASMAALGVGGQLLLSRAYARSPAPAVAVMGYAAIPLSLLGDFVVWSQGVHAVHAAGALLMVGAGVLLFRSHRTAPHRTFHLGPPQVLPDEPDSPEEPIRRPVRRSHNKNPP